MTPPSWDECGFHEKTLEKNLRALRAVQRDLADLLARGGIHDGLRLMLDASKNLVVQKRFRRRFVRIEELESEVATDPETVHVGKRIDGRLWIGLGTGERLHAAIDSTSPTTKYYVHESDPGLIYLTLAKFDWRDAITSGRVTFFLGSDFDAIPFADIGVIARHPLMLPFATDAFERAVAAAASPSIDVGPPIPKTRALVLEGELLERELVAALTTHAFETWILPITSLSKDEIAREVAGYRPDIVMSINFHPEFAPIAAQNGVPYVAWEIDPSASMIPSIAADDVASAGTWIFTWKKSRVALYRAAGWTHVEHLAIAADPGTRTATTLDPWLANAAIFVGSCMRSNARRLIETFVRGVAQDGAHRNAWAGMLGDVRALEAAIEKNPCVRGIEDMLHDLLDRRSLPSAMMIDGAPADVVVLLGESLAATKRCALARLLARDPEFRVFGEEDWRAEIPARTYLGPIAHGAALSCAYASAAITIDMNRVYQADIATLRIFEAIAAGGFVVAEWSEDIPALFDVGREIVTYSSVAELEDAIGHFRAHPDLRRAIAAAGRERLLRDHTVVARVETMLGRVFVSA